MGPPSDRHCAEQQVDLEAMLRRTALRRGVPLSECDDCVQDAWLALRTQHPDWPLERASTRAWLAAVVRNHAVSFRRELRRHPKQRLDEVSANLCGQSGAGGAAHENDLESSSQPEHECSEIDRLLSGLTSVDREIVVLRAGGRTYGEIGQALGLQAASARARYLRLIRKLRGRANLA
jgi:RNA polymerase sigma factor (sigma-70 family)